MRTLFVVNFAAPPMIRKVNKYVIPNLNTCNPSQACYRKCRLIFIVFYLAAGTTDTPCEVTFNPSPSEKDISFILNEVKNYLSEDVTVRRGDVLSAWAGIRPLVKDPNKEDTQSLVRNHIIHVSPSGKLYKDEPVCLRQITLRIVEYHFSSRPTATLNLCLIYLKIT